LKLLPPFCVSAFVSLTGEHGNSWLSIND